MILPFSTHINGKPTMFTNKIVKGIWQNNPNLMRELSLSRELPEHYVFEDLTVFETHILTTKLHTIREDKNDRWKAGTKIDFFINCRQPNMFRFAPVLPVVSVQKIEIVYYSNRETIMNDLPPKRAVIIDDKKRLSDKEIQALAKNDGFDSLDDFFAYFENGFTGKLIHWTDLKY